MGKKILFLLLAFVLLLTSAPMLTQAQTVEQLRVGISSDENTLNPYTYVTGSPGLDLVHLMYDTLFQLDDKNIPIPWLVKDYKVSEDGLTYDLTLHENIMFHDGQPLTANDVKFTIDYFNEYPKSRFTNPLADIQSFEINSDTEFTITLGAADPNFMIQPLADLPILPKHIWSEIDNPDESDNNIGSGPYKLSEHRSGEYYRLEANKEYFLGEPPIGELILPIIEDTTALFTALQSGELDVVSANVSPELVKQFEGNENVKIDQGAGFSTTLLQLNSERYPMSDKDFRKAISLAIDNQYLIDTILLGYAEVGSPGFIHPESPFFNDQLSVDHDMDAARQTLLNAGFEDTNGDGFVEGQDGEEISLEMLVYSDSPTRIRTAEIITEWMNDIGIETSVRAMDMTTVDSLVWPGFDVSQGRDFDLSIWGWSSTMQIFPDRIIELFHSDPSIGSVNIGGYSNEEFDKLAAELQDAIDEGERKELILELQQLITDETPIVTLYYQEIINAYNPNVYDDYTFQLGKGLINKLSFVTLDNEDKEQDDASEVMGGEASSEVTGEEEIDTEAIANESGGRSTLLYLLLGVIVIAGGLFFLKKKGAKKS
ncbi:peptide ABC transporter substrate-binding protein [Virgibacillus indicus]|uniref:Peptide ABC transporter substrate-binding protein n=1 Tax=Virgibacillus indicus TaxID=2024554 RepID=A0A265NAT8_9BACI|nr:ABC transporter substrate-binding protein [Virgibacillus indicus]OZU89113.1 peptide ABC transporter substrate-binding protein [Virgibacillus indicus]